MDTQTVSSHSFCWTWNICICVTDNLCLSAGVQVRYLLDMQRHHSRVKKKVIRWQVKVRFTLPDTHHGVQLEKDLGGGEGGAEWTRKAKAVTEFLVVGEDCCLAGSSSPVNHWGLHRGWKQMSIHPPAIPHWTTKFFKILKISLDTKVKKTCTHQTQILKK